MEHSSVQARYQMKRAQGLGYQFNLFKREFLSSQLGDLKELSQVIVYTGASDFTPSNYKLLPNINIIS